MHDSSFNNTYSRSSTNTSLSIWLSYSLVCERMLWLALL